MIFAIVVFGAMLLTGSLWPMFAAYGLIGLVFLAGFLLARSAHRNPANDARHGSPVVRR